MKAIGIATWEGSWKEGSGTISTDGPTFKNVPYTFSSRFEGTVGANPEELLAAAHAGCFNQALANIVGKAGLVVESLETRVTVNHDYSEGRSPEIGSIIVTTAARVPGASKVEFHTYADRAKARCTISRILNCGIVLEAVLLT